MSSVVVGAGTPRGHPGPGYHQPGGLLVVYGRLIGPLLAGYLLFDRAFAYLHLPGTPLFVSEMLLGLGVLAVLTATGYLLVPARDEPVLALLALFVAWGLVRAVPGLEPYGLNAVRDSALWYYGLFAFLVVAVLARAPWVLGHLVDQLGRLTPWLLLWLPVALLLVPFVDAAPTVPFTTMSVLSHKPGNAAVAALLAIGFVVLFPERLTPRVRALCVELAFVSIALAGTQNRGGLLGAVAGASVGMVFLRHRLRLALQAAAVCGVGLLAALLLFPTISYTGGQGRDFSPVQLVENVVSVFDDDSGDGGLRGTVNGREQLWRRVLDRQVADGLLVVGAGFGPNLAANVGVYDEGRDTLRNPHNSHLNILARMGLVGLGMWIALWTGWYWAVVAGCRRLARGQQHTRRRVAVLALTVVTAIQVSSVFDPQLEGPQVAALLWTLFGVGLAATSTRSSVADGPGTTISSAVARRPAVRSGER